MNAAGTLYYLNILSCYLSVLFLPLRIITDHFLKKLSAVNSKVTLNAPNYIWGKTLGNAATHGIHALL